MAFGDIGISIRSQMWSW